MADKSHAQALKAPRQKRRRPAGSALPSDKKTTTNANTWLVEALNYLAHRQTLFALHDCPLPELFRVAQRTDPGLTIGQFHDGLRSLHEELRIYLHPWTGPLYDIPEPALALLIGHEIAYYANLRN